MAGYTYRKVISNSYLNKRKEVKAATYHELEEKAKQQLAIWDKQEKTQRDKEARLQQINDLKEKTVQLNKASIERLHSYDTILETALNKDNYKVQWESLKKTFNYPPFVYNPFSFNESMPIKKEMNWFINNLQVPQKSFWEKIIKSKAILRKQKETEAKLAYEKYCNEYEKQLSDYNQRKRNAEKKYEQEKNNAFLDYNQKKKETEKEVSEHNDSIDKLRHSFEAGESEAISNVIDICLSQSAYPDEFSMEYQVSFSNVDNIIVVSAALPNINEFSTIKEYKFVASTKTIKEIKFKKNELENIYDLMIKQTALRVLYEIFNYDYPKNIQSAVFNGWVDNIDKATGQDYTACILSVQMKRSEFESINFNQIDITSCIRNLKGLYSGNLSLLAPVKPIMNIDTSDSRFVTSHDVLETLDNGDNLATMDWEDFEHLVRELFSKYFSSDGQEVQVTQSSRDGGVDAIAFDSDPIRGGKYVIQAKRYNRVVPVSAVRDLYGTMINEGAVKGILVTTSYFGNDSRDFVKDKPISLIDGSNLIHMCSDFGYNVHIELQH